jgi:hypothetical protein
MYYIKYSNGADRRKEYTLAGSRRLFSLVLALGAFVLSLIFTHSAKQGEKYRA